MLEDGSVATWTGQGVGKMTGRGFAVGWRRSLLFQTASAQLVRLNGTAVVFRFEVDENGNTHTRRWRWK